MPEACARGRAAGAESPGGRTLLCRGSRARHPSPVRTELSVAGGGAGRRRSGAVSCLGNEVCGDASAAELNGGSSPHPTPASGLICAGIPPCLHTRTSQEPPAFPPRPSLRWFFSAVWISPQYRKRGKAEGWMPAQRSQCCSGTGPAAPLCPGGALGCHRARLPAAPASDKRCRRELQTPHGPLLPRPANEGESAAGAGAFRSQHGSGVCCRAAEITSPPPVRIIMGSGFLNPLSFFDSFNIYL